MFYWTPKRLKELKERGYKLKYYRYKPEWKNYTIEEEEEMKKNPTLVKNMKHVKVDQIPPLSGPDPRGLINQTKQDKPNQLEKLNGRHRQGFNRNTKKG